MDEAFGIDAAALEKAYFDVQNRYHPDRMMKKSVLERQAAMHLSADANKAYQTLKRPLTRAQYLLSLKDIVVGTEKDTIKPSPELLAEVMEWRTDIEHAATHPHLLDALETMLHKQHEQSLHIIAREYGNRLWEAMAQETLRLGYIIKAQEDILKHKQRLKQHAS